jgi:hypothetical protein
MILPTFPMGVKLGPSRSGKKTDYVLENRVLRRIFGPERDEVAGYRKSLHNAELYTLCRTTHQILLR